MKRIGPRTEPCGCDDDDYHYYFNPRKHEGGKKLRKNRNRNKFLNIIFILGVIIDLFIITLDGIYSGIDGVASIGLPVYNFIQQYLKFAGSRTHLASGFIASCSNAESSSDDELQQ